MQDRKKAVMLNSRILEYLEMVMPKREGLLEEIRLYAFEAYIPIIRGDVENLLRLLLTLAKPGRILEIGTAVGYSTLVLAESAPDADIITIEKDPARVQRAALHFSRAGVLDRIVQKQGDAGEILKDLAREEVFDFIFLDGAKAQYIRWLPFLIKMMAPGALLVSDNCLQEGDIALSPFALSNRRDRTIHTRMRQFIEALLRDPRFLSGVYTIGDGVCVSMKRASRGKQEEYEH